MEIVYTFLNVLVMPFWLMMMLAPHWAWTKRIMGSLWPVGLVALLYAVLLLSQVGPVMAGLANPTLATIAAMLGQPIGATIAWAHLLAFDLFVGRWAFCSICWDERPFCVDVCNGPKFTWWKLVQSPRLNQS